jgi:SulP family sulfate permease
VAMVALTTLLTGLAAQRWSRKLPPMLVAMVAGSLIGYALNRILGEQSTGIRTLGLLPSALPPLSSPDLSFENLRTLLGVAVAVTLLSLTQAISISRAIALKSGQHLDSNQEFIGQGLSNIAASFFSGYPSSASVTRCGINYEAGARTPLAAVFSALLLVTVLLGIAPLVSYLPAAAIAGLLFLVAWRLIDFAYVRAVLRTSRGESIILVITFLSTLLLPLELAILLGITASLVNYLNRTSHPTLRSLVPDPRHTQRKMTETAAGLPECPQLKILRIEGSIYFGAVNHVQTHFDALQKNSPRQKHLLLMAKSINFIDIAGAGLLAREAQRRRESGGALYFYSPRQPVKELLESGDYTSTIGSGHIFQSKDQAIHGVFARLDHAVCAICAERVFNECRTVPRNAPDE